MNDTEKVDIGKILTKSSSELNDSATIYPSLRKLRRCLIKVDSVVEFRLADGVTNLLILFKRFSVQLVSLHLKNDENRNKYDQILNETVGLLANCCHLDENCKFVIKTSQFLTNLVPLLQLDSLNLDIVASSFRLLGNLCDIKECASSVLQTRSLISLIVHWMVKKLNSEKPDPIKMALLSKMRDLALRIFRLAAKCSSSFGRFLMHNDVAYHVAKFLIKPPEEEKSKLKYDIPQDKTLTTLIELASCKDANFAEQFVRADLANELMQLANNPSSDDTGRSKSSREICKLARRLLFSCISDYSDIRIEVAKYGAVEFVHTLASQPGCDKFQFLLLLSKFCRDAFTRVKLRETDSLSTLLDAFADSKYDLEAKNELMSCFVCFLYDDNGLVYLLKRSSFLPTIVELIKRYSLEKKCTFGHSSSSSSPNRDLDEEESKPLYRPDSPSYVRLRSRISIEECSDQQNQQQFTHRLCKDFLCPSPSSIYSSTNSSAGWSPSSSILTRSPSWSSESMSDEELNDDGAELFRNEWIEESLSSSSGSSKRCYAKALCGCIWVPSTAIELCWENLTNSIVLFLSFLSHNDNYVENLIVEKSLLEAVVGYISNVCRPQPRAGRMLKRLARNRNLTEKLLKMEFHQLISSYLCSPECSAQSLCIRCRKLNRIGCDILLSLSAQVDSDFGFGILAHDVLSGSPNERFAAFCAVCCLIKTSGRRKRFLIEYGGFEEILNGFFDSTDQTTNGKSLKALTELVSRQKLIVMWSNETCRTYIGASLECEFAASKLAAELNSDDEFSNSTNSIVKFVSDEDEHETLEVYKKTLIRHSPFFSGMFAGNFVESSRTVLTCKDSGVTFKSLEIFVHLLHGCRQCPIFGSRSIDWHHVIELLTLANQHLRDDLFRYLVDYVVAGFLTKINVGQFLTISLLHENFRLFEICIIYLFSFCTSEKESCDVLLKLLLDNDRLKELLEKYLKSFLKQFI